MEEMLREHPDQITPHAKHHHKLCGWIIPVWNLIVTASDPLVPSQKDLEEGKQSKGIDPRQDTSEALPGYMAQMQLGSAIITMAFHFF